MKAFIEERFKSLWSKKIVGAVGGVALLDGHPWPQAAIIIVAILAQAWVDRK